MEKLKQLDEVFSISICAYAVMHNHTHTVLKIDRVAALKWHDADKTGAIPMKLASILGRLNIDPEAWFDSVWNFGKNYNTVIETREGIKRYTQAIGRKWFCASGYSDNTIV